MAYIKCSCGEDLPSEQLLIEHLRNGCFSKEQAAFREVVDWVRTQMIPAFQAFAAAFQAANEVKPNVTVEPKGNPSLCSHSSLDHENRRCRYCGESFAKLFS